MIPIEGIKHLRHTDAGSTGVFVSFNGTLIGAMTPSQILEATVGFNGDTGSIVRYRRDYKGEMVLRDDAISSAETEILHGEVAFFYMEPPK